MFIKQPYILCCVFPCSRIYWVTDGVYNVSWEAQNMSWQSAPASCLPLYVGSPSRPRHTVSTKKKKKWSCQVYDLCLSFWCMSWSSSVWKERKEMNLQVCDTAPRSPLSRCYLWPVSSWWTVTCLTLWLFRYKDIVFPSPQTLPTSQSLHHGDLRGGSRLVQMR